VRDNLAAVAYTIGRFVGIVLFLRVIGIVIFAFNSSRSSSCSSYGTEGPGLDDDEDDDPFAASGFNMHGSEQKLNRAERHRGESSQSTCCAAAAACETRRRCVRRQQSRAWQREGRQGPLQQEPDVASMTVDLHNRLLCTSAFILLNYCCVGEEK
jgi:hypothetical protein